jgi:hypothetical protein
VKRARFVSVASHEFLAEVAYYDEARPGHGARFITAVQQATARALAFPLSGSPAAAATLRVLVRDFPFSIVGYARWSDLIRAIEYFDEISGENHQPSFRNKKTGKSSEAS